MTESVRVGQFGAGFIGRVHSLAYRGAAAAQRPLGAGVEMSVIADQDRAAATELAGRYGWARVGSSWAEVVEDPAVDLFDNAAPNDLHEEPCVAAARNGKHVLCEKPLAPDADAAFRTWSGVAASDVLHQCGFMYRFIPAIALARQMIEAGEIGDVFHFRARFLLSFAVDDGVPMSWRFEQQRAGQGALGDLGSHHIDLARFLVGEVTSVAAATAIRIPERSGGAVTNDDEFAALARLQDGTMASFEGSRIAGNHGLTSRVEIDGSLGSLAFDFERLNELTISKRGETGFRTILVTQAEHPFSDFWFPVGIQGQHPISWADCFAHQAHCMVSAIAEGRALPPEAPTLEDGYRVAEVVDGMVAASEERTWHDLRYRDLDSKPAPLGEDGA